jgi:hypothetical protein
MFATVRTVFTSKGTHGTPVNVEMRCDFSPPARTAPYVRLRVAGNPIDPAFIIVPSHPSPCARACACMRLQKHNSFVSSWRLEAEAHYDDAR